MVTGPAPTAPAEERTLPRTVHRGRGHRATDLPGAPLEAREAAHWTHVGRLPALEHVEDSTSPSPEGRRARLRRTRTPWALAQRRTEPRVRDPRHGRARNSLDGSCDVVRRAAHDLGLRAVEVEDDHRAVVDEHVRAR